MFPVSPLFDDAGAVIKLMRGKRQKEKEPCVKRLVIDELAIGGQNLAMTHSTGLGAAGFLSSKRTEGARSYCKYTKNPSYTERFVKD